MLKYKINKSRTLILVNAAFVFFKGSYCRGYLDFVIVGKIDIYEEHNVLYRAKALF